MQAAVGCTAPLHPRPTLRRKLKSYSVLRKPLPLTLNPIAKSNRKSITPCNSSSDNPTSISSNQYADWDWATWSRHFNEIDRAESYVSILQFQLEEAIAKEDFFEATKLKKSISESASKDVVAQVMSELKNAIKEQRYQDASILSRQAGTGLIGWWVGHGKESHDFVGRIVKITPEVGRYVATSYSPRQLVTKSTGKPLFEIFLLKNDDGTYTTKVVFFKAKNLSKRPPSGFFGNKIDPNENDSSEKDENALGKDEDALEKDENALDKDKIPSEGQELNIINFLKQRMPAFNARVVDPEDSVQHLMHEPDEKEEDEDNNNNNDEETDGTDLDADEKYDEEDEDVIDKARRMKLLKELRHLMRGPGDRVKDDDVSGTDLDADEKEILSDKLKVFIGGVLHNKDHPSSIVYERVPAEVSLMEKDSFLLSVPQNVPGVAPERDLIAQAAAELMPADLAQILLGANKGAPKQKKDKDVQEMSGLVIGELQALQQRIFNRVSKETVFNRIPIDSDSRDPFTGLYVGSFGPYGPEVIQLTRRFGQWDSDNLEFFEYVEAVKLTGDFNVPAGQVTFRAKIGNRINNDGFFPDSFGVKAFYQGEGRIAKGGYKEPEWVQGKLLELNEKSMGPLKGAKLGFVYLIHKRNVLVLFDRLNLE